MTKIRYAIVASVILNIGVKLMKFNGDTILIAAGVLGFIAAIYMIISNIFFNKDYSAVAIGAGLVSILSLTLLKGNKAK